MNKDKLGHCTLFNGGCFKCGFTLAEVLITLGIIGVVASMTIPTLMVDINTRQWVTAADVFDKKLNEAMKNMNTSQVISGHPNTLSFVNELSNHFKINKICKNDELQNCFSETVYWGAGEATPEEVDMTAIRQASHFGLDWGTELIGVQFANGVTGLVAYNPSCWGDPLSNQFKGTGCISMLYDTSGNKSPNTSGKDIKNFGAINRLGNSGCFAEVGDICITMAPQEVAPHVWNACDQQGNSTDPEDLAFMSKYGIENCYSEPPEHIGYAGIDGWAAAVEMCGGADKMASMADLAKIADYVYNTSGIGEIERVENLTLDEEKAAALGLPSGEFEIWSGELYGYANAYSRDFRSDMSIPWNDGRELTGLLVICVE